MLTQEVVVGHSMLEVIIILGHSRNDNGDTQIEDDAPAGRVDGQRPTSPGGDAKLLADGFRRSHRNHARGQTQGDPLAGKPWEIADCHE